MTNRRSRLLLLLVLFFVIVVGIVSRLIHFNALVIDKYLGDALYAVMFYLLLSLFWPQGTPARKAAIILIFVTAIELFQLTGIPLGMRQRDNIGLKALSIVLGTGFSWWDMAAYGAGVMGVYGSDLLFFNKYAGNNLLV